MTEHHPKLKLVGNPVLSRESSGMESYEGSEASSIRKGMGRRESESGTASTEDELPVFERHEESTAIELFYDLFFVANLTTFSNLHEIGNVKTLTSYVGFFCILWFTWCQTSLYDIRFVSDSLMARLAKGCHLGVMVGLAVVGPKYDTTDHISQLRIMSLILMVSRIVLGCQYFLVLWHVRTYKNTKIPLSLIGGSNFGAAIIYFGVSFAFSHTDHAYRAFYVLAVAEMVINIGVAAHWKVVTFKGTHLIERMSLLTLYILGEGVIDILKSVAKISANQDHWTPANIGTLIGAIAGIYLLYMLYFDTLNRHHFGSIRQQIWSFAHFPFHTALVLCLSGMAQFIIWQKIMEAVAQFSSQMSAQVESFLSSNATYPDAESLTNGFISAVNSTLTDVFKTYPPSNNTATSLEVGETVNELSEKFLEWVTEVVNSNSSSDSPAAPDSVQTATQTVGLAVLNSIMETYGFDPPENPNAGELGVIGKTNAEFDTATLVFEYFFIASGFTIIFMGFLGLINVRTYTKGSWLRFATHIIFGSVVCLLTLLVTQKGGEAAFTFAETAWPLPTISLAILIVLAVHHMTWEAKPKPNGEKQYNFLPRWLPNRN